MSLQREPSDLAAEDAPDEATKGTSSKGNEGGNPISFLVSLSGPWNTSGSGVWKELLPAPIVAALPPREVSFVLRNYSSIVRAFSLRPFPLFLSAFLSHRPSCRPSFVMLLPPSQHISSPSSSLPL